MLIALLAATVFLAFANGANDVSKGISTLVGAGVSSYGRAVSWGTFCTVAGALTAAFTSQVLIATFSGKGILTHPSTSPAFLLSIACGATLWLIVATLTGLPVSTTHSLAGALVGAALMQSGAASVLWGSLARKIALPLAVSPLVSLLLVLAVSPLLRPFLARREKECLCVDEGAALVTPEGMTLREGIHSITIGNDASCETAALRFGTIDTLHWISAGATSFFRGLNDTPKILALGIAAGTLLGIARIPMFAAIAGAMGAGSLIAGVRVTRTLAEKVTRISPPEGFTANLVTATLVGLASSYALPVSTTHVSAGAIVGAGVSRGVAVRRGTLRDIALAWLVTLPVSAALAAMATLLVR